MDEWNGETSHLTWSEDKRGIALVTIPAIGGILNLVAAPVAVITHGPHLLFSLAIAAMVIIGSMVAVSRDARALGFEPSILVLFFWIVGYPQHMAQRRRRGMYFGVGWGWVGILLFLVMPVVVLLGAASVLSAFSRSHSSSPSTTGTTTTASPASSGAAVKCTSVSCKMKRVTPEALTVLAALSTKSIELTPDSTDDDIATLSLVPDLQRISIRDHKTEIDLTPLHTLHALKIVDLYDSKVKSLAPLEGLSLDELAMGNSKGITDWAPLGTLTSLHTFTAYDAGLTSIQHVLPLKNLRKLDIGLNPKLSDLTGIEALTALEVLDLYGSQHITDLSPLAKLLALKTLKINAASRTSLPALALPHLASLDASTNDLTDLTPLKPLVSLTSLNLEHNPRLKDISVLATLTKLESIFLGRTAVESLAPLSHLPALKTLQLFSATSIKSLAPLATVKTLKDVTVPKDFPEAEIDAFKKLHPTVTVRRN